MWPVVVHGWPGKRCPGCGSAAHLRIATTMGDILRYHLSVGDLLIRDVPDDVVAGLDTRAAEVGLSRVEYIRRRLAQDALVSRVSVTLEDLQRLGEIAAGLGDEDLMRRAWG